MELPLHMGCVKHLPQQEYGTHGLATGIGAVQATLEAYNSFQPPFDPQQEPISLELVLRLPRPTS